MGLRARTWGKIAFGVLVIGGTMATLWAIYRPDVAPVVETRKPPAVPVLYRTSATVTLLPPGSAPSRRATIRCDGRTRSATGFWAKTPAEACDALASTRPALLASAGCASTRTDRLRMHVTGAFGPRRVDHVAQQGGCPDPREWLSVNALASAVRPPEQQLDGRSPKRQ
jgi:hypothetical protein